MATYRLFPSTVGPTSPASYTGPFLAGVQFEVTTGGCWLDGYWWWVCPSGQSTAAQKFALWCVYNNDAAILVATATATSSTLTPGKWNYIPLDSPIPLAIGATYIACTGFSGGFPNTTGQFGSGDPFSAGIIDGPLSAFSDQSGSFPAPLGMSQGLFGTAGSDPTVTMPEQGFESANFWIDVQIDTTPPTGASYRLWPNYPQLPGQVSIDTGAQTTGTQFSLSEACALDNIWFYSPTTLSMGGPVTVLPTRCAIFDVATQAVVAGTDNTSPSWTGPAGSGWVACPYSGVQLPAGDYKVAVYYGGGEPFYQENIHYFSSPQSSEEDILKSLSPAAWWELADAVGSATASDSSANAHNGTVHGGVIFGQTGPLAPGTAALFDGSTGYLSTSLQVPSGLTALSLVAWVKIPSNNNQVSGIVGNGGLSLQLISSGSHIGIEARLGTSSGTYQGTFVSGTAWGDNNWHHVAVVWNGSTVTAYLDGAAVGTPGTLGGTLAPGTTAVTVGSVAGAAYLLGTLAHCTVFDNALSSVAVGQLYHQSTGFPVGAGAAGITAGPLSCPNIGNSTSCIGNSTGALMTGNSTYQDGPFAYPNNFDVNDGGENRWIDVEVTPAAVVVKPPPGGTANSGAFLVFFP